MNILLILSTKVLMIITFEQDGLKIFVDTKSLTFLKGSTIDYVDGGLNKGIKFLNPNAKAVCGCGESFTL